MAYPAPYLAEILRELAQRRSEAEAPHFPSTTSLWLAVPLPTLRVGRRILA